MINIFSSIEFSAKTAEHTNLANKNQRRASFARKRQSTTTTTRLSLQLPTTMEDPYDEYAEVLLSTNESKSSRRSSTGSSNNGGELRSSLGERSATGGAAASSMKDSNSSSKKQQRHQQHKQKRKARTAERRRKEAIRGGQVDPGWIEDYCYDEEPSTNADSSHVASDTSSIHSGGEAQSESESEESSEDEETHTGIRMALQQAAKSPKKTKLILANLGISMGDIPLKHICEGKLGKTLHKLSLANNHLESVPHQLVQSLPMLVNLDLSNCHLRQLPPDWNLPRLEKLNLSENLLCDCPDEVRRDLVFVPILLLFRLQQAG